MRALTARLAGPLLTAILCLFATSAHAQSQVRVTASQVNVWQAGFAIVATVAREGDVFDVVGRQGNWVEVILPGPEWQPRRTGFIAASRVEVIGSPLPDQPNPRRATRQTTPQSRAQTRNVLRILGEAGYGWFSANQSFAAIVGKDHGPWVGAGARYEIGPRYFVEGSVERYQATGERVFVFEDVVYGLGIADRVSVTPFMGTVGVRYPSRRYTSYAGAGIGAYLLRETSDFADDADNVRRTKAAYRGVVGVEWPIARKFSAGLEAQFTSVPDALTGAVAEAFKESNLGGVQIRARLLFGR